MDVRAHVGGALEFGAPVSLMPHCRPGRYAEVHILVLLTPWQVACETSQPPYLGLPQGEAQW